MCASKSIPEHFNSLLEVFSYFSSEEVAHNYLYARRWANKLSCAHCGHDKVYCFADKRRFKCGGCKKQFNVRKGTIYENSKIPLRTWFIATYVFISHKKGISSHQLARDLKVTQKTAWYILQRIRHQLGVDNDPNEQLEEIVEIDESFVGGKNKNRHHNKKVEKCQGRSFKDKTPILGILQRGGKVKTITIPHTGRDLIEPLVQQIVKPGSIVMTDEWHAYNGLHRDYDHYVVNHGKGQYGDAFVNTNSIEGFWPWIKRMIMGIYHVVSRKYLQYYAHEATFRFNTRLLSDGARMAYALALNSSSLKYKKLTGKA